MSIESAEIIHNYGEETLSPTTGWDELFTAARRNSNEKAVSTETHGDYGWLEKVKLITSQGAIVIDRYTEQHKELNGVDHYSSGRQRIELNGTFRTPTGNIFVEKYIETTNYGDYEPHITRPVGHKETKISDRWEDSDRMTTIWELYNNPSTAWKKAGFEVNDPEKGNVIYNRNNSNRRWDIL